MSRTIRKKNPIWKEIINNRSSDKKPFYKPDKNFKKIAKSKRKAKEKAAIKKLIDEKSEIVPKFPKQDIYDWF